MASKICIIPARLESSRFPNKILTDINGKKMFVAVYDIAIESGVFDQVYVATHNKEVLSICESLNIPSIKTNSNHVCGSSRVFEAAKKIDSADWDIVVNLQADQPFLPGSYLKIVINGLRNNSIATIAYSDNLNISENTVKIILDRDKTGVYFSRLPIPYNISKTSITRYCHLGLYAFKREFVLNYKGDFQSQLALSESLEQLDFIYNGYKIDVELVDHAVPEVNTPEDINEAIDSGWI
jgi:3-deoxy-manno-octulosonate cytidylyltransferase (CMP-KDO synthetase)